MNRSQRRREKVQDNDDLVFLDLSHFVFQRFFAIQRWCKISGRELAIESELLDVFESRFIASLTDLKKKLGFAWKNLYIVKDCTRDAIWRMELYPDYKGNRNEKPDCFNPSVFVSTYQKILPWLMDTHGVKIISHPRAEADDVIAVVHAYIRNSAIKDREVTIITNDNDYLQLLDPKTKILNSKLIELKTRYDDVTLSVFGLWKAIRGDPSDNILSIERKLGDKTALKLALNPELLYKKSHEAQARLDLNKRLVLFSNIPADIRDDIEACIINANYF